MPLAERWVAGGLRGEGPTGSQLSTCQNQVGGVPGAAPGRVPWLVAETFAELHQRAGALDDACDRGQRLPDAYEDVLRLCAWAHGQWVRIHPFVDHNGSTARLLALQLGLRYRLDLPLPAKPRDSRPTAGLQLTYDVASRNQMHGDDGLMVLYLHDLVLSTP